MAFSIAFVNSGITSERQKQKTDGPFERFSPNRHSKRSSLFHKGMDKIKQKVAKR